MDKAFPLRMEADRALEDSPQARNTSTSIGKRQSDTPTFTLSRLFGVQHGLAERPSLDDVGPPKGMPADMHLSSGSIRLGCNSSH